MKVTQEMDFSAWWGGWRWAEKSEKVEAGIMDASSKKLAVRGRDGTAAGRPRVHLLGCTDLGKLTSWWGKALSGKW